MAVHLRLRRMGAKKRAFYRIVAVDSRRARGGSYLENLGTYNPITKPAEIKVSEERLIRWLDLGAVPSDTVWSLLKQIGFSTKYQQYKKGEDVSEVTLKTTITERPKKTRKMKKAAVAAEAEAKAKAEAKVKAEAKPAAETTEAEGASDTATEA
ncbi:MAG: 30S ribosomal protein S16 [candidate division Zixibacteria bacterium]|nr:30S ribosomal protein S16 [candidate division Zixibacteria bacterium]